MRVMYYSPIQQPILNFPFIFQISIMEYTTTQHRSPQSELFDLLDRLQSARLDDQRCELPNFNNGSGKNSSQNSQGGGAGSNNSDSRQSASKLMLQRILKHPDLFRLLRDADNEQTNPLDGHSRLQAIISKANSTEGIRWVIQWIWVSWKNGLFHGDVPSVHLPPCIL